MSLDAAIQRLQALALSSTDINIKAAPNYPVEDAGMLPLAIAHIGSGTGTIQEATTTLLLFNVLVDVHFSLNNLSAAYAQIDLFIPEYLKRLAGDPTLSGAVDTIVFPVTFEVLQLQWNTKTTVGPRFTIPLKFRETPIT